MRKSNYKLYIWLASIAAILILFYTQWDHWFGDLPEPAFSLSNSPQRLIITPGQDGAHDRSFSWVNGEECSFIFTLQRDSVTATYQPTHREIKTGGGTTHTYGVKLKGLQNGVYQYYVTSKEVPDTLQGHFEIKPYEEKIDFLLIGDIQDQKWCENPDFFMEINCHFPSVDAVLFIGDMLERPHDQYWAMFYQSLVPYATHTPFIAVPGNHEYKLGGLSSLGARYTAAFQMPENGPEKKKSRTFYIDYPLVRIIGLDTNMLITNYFGTKSWLKSTLTSSYEAPFTIVMGHHGVYSVRKGRSNPLMKYGLNPIFKEHGVDLILQGHDHAYSRNGSENSLPIYITQATSAKTYAVGHPEKHDISLTGERLYSHIEITSDTLYFSTYREDHTLFDKFKISKN